MGALRYKAFRRLPLFAALAIAPLGLISVAQAMSGHGGASASSFIVDYGPQTKNFSAVTTHYGKRNPFLLSTNQQAVGKDAHCGVMINSDGQPGLAPFDRLSFWYKGSPETRAFVTFKPSAGAFITSYLTVKDGRQIDKSSDGFKHVIFDKSLWGICPGSTIKEIAIVPPPVKEAGPFKVDEIRLDNNPVKKILATFLFPPREGPAGTIPPHVEKPRRMGAESQTGIMLSNGTSQDVYAWVQLGNGLKVDDTFKTKTSGGKSPYTVTWTYLGYLPGGLPDKTSGYTLLKARDGAAPYSISSIDYPGNFSGNVTFTPAANGASTFPTPNCPSAMYPCGHNQAEWALNVGSSAGEAANNSLNNGVNSQIMMDYTDNGSGSYPSQTSCTTSSNSCWTISADSGAIFPTRITNHRVLTANNNLPGIYPFNCPCCSTPICSSGAGCNFLYPGYAPPGTCTSNANNSCSFPFSGPQISNWGANTSQSCQVARAAGVSGGKVKITVTGFNTLCR